MFSFFRTKSLEHLTDETLLAQFQQGGDLAYLSALYERYMPMVYGVCLKIYRDPVKSQDAVMGIFEELVRKAKEHRIESFRGWLYVLARNYCLMEWRKNHRHRTNYHAPENMEHFDAVEAAFDVELPVNKAKPLEKCLGELPQHQRKSVELFYFEDKSYKDIAVILAEEVGKVRSYIQNGRRNLRICLEKAGVRGIFES